MQDPHLAIERLISVSLRDRLQGNYEASYLLLEEAVAGLEDECVPAEIRCRVLLEAARGAYYLTRFDEGLCYLDQLRTLFQNETLDSVRIMEAESGLIRANILRRRGSFREALSCVVDCADDILLEDSPRLVAERHLIEGACRFYLNEISRAQQCLEVALGLATHCKDLRLSSRVLTMLGFLARSKGRHIQAEDYFMRAVLICRSCADYYGEAAAALNMGIVQYRSGRFPDAKKSVLRAKSLFEKITWHLGTCRCLLALGNIRKYERDFSSALKRYKRALKLAEGNKFKREIALALEFIGEINFERGDYREAHRNYARAMKIADEIAPDGDIVIELKRRLGELYAALDERETALSNLQEGCVLAVRLEERFEEGLIERAMGKLHFSSGARAEGKAHFRRAVELLKGAGGAFELASTRLLYAETLLGGILPSERRHVDPVEEDADGDEEAWSSLIEAGKSFREMRVSFWSERVDILLAQVAARRRIFSHMGTRVVKNRKIVEIEYSPDFMIHTGLVAVSLPMQELWQQVNFAARYARPVLITGETGTGKELIARIIHTIGDRGNRPFVAVNCAAVPDHLFESEFFGHLKGCFTGALTDRRGLFEEARGGTLFLDEVGELTTIQQVKLLRALQEGKVRRVGENKEFHIDVRIISATNRNLEERLEGLCLRKDFFYRINAEHINVPPLRERSEDIVPLVSHFFRNGGERNRIKIESTALKFLLQYSWPGNVRELITVIDRVKCMVNGGVITLDMFPQRITNRIGSKRSETLLGDGYRGPGLEKTTLKKTLVLCRGNKSAAAKRLGISRGTLYRELRNNGLDHLIR